MWADIEDGHPRSVDYTTTADGEILSSTTDVTNSGSDVQAPASLFYWFDGVQQGDVSNDGAGDDVDYVQAIADHTKTPPTTFGYFAYGASSPTNYADFDASYQPINGLNYNQTGSRYTVQQGDTLQSIAQAVWGDANFWYLIADANGIQSNDQLIAGMDIVIPNKVANVSNSSSTFRVYDPNLYLGDTSPTHPPKPQNHHNCGVFGQILETVVAVAVSYFFGPIAGDIAKQGVALLDGDQSKFNWKEVGVTAATAVLVGPGGGSLVDTVAHAAVYDAVYQGLDIAVGNQKKFDWLQLGVSAVTAGVSHEVQVNTPFGTGTGTGQIDLGGANGFATNFVSGMAGAIAGATARTLVNGTDFGDNLIATLPDVIGNTLGNAIGDQISAEFDDPLLAQIQAAGAAAAQAPLPVDAPYADLEPTRYERAEY
jgi:LysM repeat protein